MGVADWIGRNLPWLSPTAYLGNQIGGGIGDAQAQAAQASSGAVPGSPPAVAQPPKLGPVVRGAVQGVENYADTYAEAPAGVSNGIAAWFGLGQGQSWSQRGVGLMRLALLMAAFGVPAWLIWRAVSGVARGAQVVTVAALPVAGQVGTAAVGNAGRIADAVRVWRG
mgnify:CR=1 FL=1